jgi:D-sedoheptulose 7-phosphate isomerase
VEKTRQDSSLATVVARKYLLESSAVKRDVAEQCLDSIVAAAHLVAQTFRSEGKLLLCGNGGSAADCQHIAGELVNRLTADFPRPALPAIALTTDTSVLTAFANDFGFEGVFERQVQALGRPGDALLGISTSGSSINVLRAVAAARALGMHTMALTGARGRLKDLVDIAIAVPSDSTQHIQEAHLTIEHLLCYLVERDLYRGTGATQPPLEASQVRRE